jgi:N-acetyl-gamma-glutamyl-phosphate reductase
VLTVGIIGATGYTGETLAGILASHPRVKITVLQAIVEKEAPFSDIFPSLYGKVDLLCEKPNLKKAIMSAELLFLALPHKVSMAVAPALLKKGKNVIDLSADYRLEAAEYEKWYGAKHKDASNIKKAAYGLPELFRSDIKGARLVANPGCYPTGSSLAIAPLAKKGAIDLSAIIIDSKSGATGAGRKGHVALSFSEVNESVKAYKINEHQHKPEIDMALGRLCGKPVRVVFVPHLIPLNRGILSTVYMDLKKALNEDEVIALYRDFYEGEPFVRIMKKGALPAIRDAQYTNLCSIGIRVSGDKVIAISAIDNLLKGAAGQAVQNMNIMYGFKETEGLK